MWRSRAAHAGLKAPGIAAGDLTVDQQAKPFGVTQFGAGVLRLQVDEGGRVTVAPVGPRKPLGRHAVEPHLAELV